MLKFLNEFIHSNHSVPKMLTLQNQKQYNVTSERRDIKASLCFSYFFSF